MTSVAALVLGALLLAMAVPKAVAGDLYGAIAYDARDGRQGWSYDYDTRAAAERRALSECGAGCRVAVWFRNACGALATAPGGGWGSGWGPTRTAAERIAIDECRSAGNRGCRPAVWSCTDR